MSEESEYIRTRLDDVLKGFERLEGKIDRMRDEQVTQRAEITANNRQLGEHNRILVLGNGQKSLTVQVAEANTRIADVESDLHLVQKSSKPPTDTASVKKERLVNIGKVIGILGLIVGQVLTWVFGIPGT